MRKSKAALKTLLVVSVAFVVCMCSSQNTGSVSEDLAGKLTDSFDFDNGKEVKGDKPIEHKGDPVYPQVTSATLPPHLSAGESFSLLLFTDFSDYPNVTGAVVAVEKDGVYAGKYIDVTQKVELVSGKKQIKLTGRVSDTVDFDVENFTVKLAMHRSDGQIGNYYEWVLNVKGSKGGGTDGGIINDGSTASDGGPNDAATLDGGVKDGGVDSDAGVFDCSDYGSNLGWQCTVPAGIFGMGCNPQVDSECDSNENPHHLVTVPDFKIDKYEVTVAQYKACVDASGCTAPANACNYIASGKENHPMNCVTWAEAKAYCAWAGKRLPSEAEWEKAARGTDSLKYPWGNTGLDCNHAVMNVGGCGNTGTAQIGSKPLGVSQYGALDMTGNVFEWVEDDYHSNYYTSAPTNGSAWIDTPRGTNRVLKGGSWTNDASLHLRSSYRYGASPDSRTTTFGFRCSRD